MAASLSFCLPYHNSAVNRDMISQHTLNLLFFSSVWFTSHCKWCI